MSELFSFFIILLAALIFSRVFQRFHIPWTVALIIGGILVGPFGMNLMTPDPTLHFLKYLGLVFLMFMAGLETRLSGFQGVWREASFVGIMTSLIPFGVGALIGLFFGYSVAATLLLGIIFMSSSIAIAIPALESKNLLRFPIGKIIISSIVLQDIASLVLLAILLQYLIPGILPFPIFITLFFLSLLIVVIIRWGIPRFRRLFNKYGEYTDSFERDLRTVFVVLIGSVLVFEILGLHSIIGAFLAGLVLSETIASKTLKNKIRVMAYGLFIPVFFVMVGADTNIRVFLEAHHTVFLLLAIVFGSILAKFLSGWFAARLLHFSNTQATLVGGACIPQLSTTLAVIAVSQQHNLLPEEALTALIILSIVTVLVSPLIMGSTTEKVKKEYFSNKSKKKSTALQEETNNFSA